MSRLVKFCWFVSVFIFLVVLLWVYSYLPSSVSIQAASSGITDQFIEKEYLFYILLGIFFLSNVVIYSLYKLIHLQYLRAGVTIPDPAPRGVKHDLANWLLGFAGTLNLFYVLAMIYLSIFNNSEGVELKHYAPVVYAGPVLIVLMLSVLPFIFLRKRRG